THLEAAIQNRDGVRHSAVVAHHLLYLARRLHVLRKGHAVGDDGGLQGTDRLAGGQGNGAFKLDIEVCVQHRYSSSMRSTAALDRPEKTVSEQLTVRAAQPRAKRVVSVMSLACNQAWASPAMKASPPPVTLTTGLPSTGRWPWH